VIWRKDPLQIVTKYQEWAAQKPEPRAVILYDSMWNATRRMADAIGDGLADVGVDHKMFHMAVTDRNDVLVEVFKSRTVLLGSPTFNGGLLPSIWPIIGEMKGLKFKNKIAAAFGSFGWSGESLKIMEGLLGECKFPLIRPGIQCKWQPSAEDLEACRAFGREVGEATKKPL